MNEGRNEFGRSPVQDATVAAPHYPVTGGIRSTHGHDWCTLSLQQRRNFRLGPSANVTRSLISPAPVRIGDRLRSGSTRRATTRQKTGQSGQLYDFFCRHRRLGTRLAIRAGLSVELSFGRGNSSAAMATLSLAILPRSILGRRPAETFHALKHSRRNMVVGANQFPLFDHFGSCERFGPLPNQRRRDAL